MCIQGMVDELLMKKNGLRRKRVRFYCLHTATLINFVSTAEIHEQFIYLNKFYIFSLKTHLKQLPLKVVPSHRWQAMYVQ